MRRQLRWFVGGALLFALLVGTAGPSFAALEWNVTGSGGILLVAPPDVTATFRLNAVVVNGNAPDTIFPATGSFRITTQVDAIRGTITGGIIVKGSQSNPDAAVLYGTYLLTSGRVVTDSGPFTLLVLEGGAGQGLMAIWLNDIIRPNSNVRPPDIWGYLSAGSIIRIFSQDRQGQNWQGGNHQ